MIKITITSNTMKMKDAVDLSLELTSHCKHAHQIEIKDLNAHDGLEIYQSTVRVVANEAIKSHNK
jgi:hypothetical protein